MPCVDPVVCDMAVPETRARLSKATFRSTIFRLLRKQNHNNPRPTIATNPIPPTTPPAIAPAFEFELPADVLDVPIGFATAVPVPLVNELETLVPVIMANEDEVAGVLVAFCSARAKLKLLFVRLMLRNAQLGTVTTDGPGIGFGKVVKDTSVQSWLHVNQSI
jgi:hypothetical protein